MTNGRNPGSAASGVSATLAKCVGHPRSVLMIGDDLAGAAQIAAERDAQVLWLSEPAKGQAPQGEGAARVSVDQLASEGREVDLIVFGDSALHETDPTTYFKRFVPLLSDGGHALLTLPPAGAPGSGVYTRFTAVKLVEDAGLEVMRVDDYASAGVTARFAKSMHALVTRASDMPSDNDRALIVARRPPRQGKLSLVVGMLTLNEEEAVEQMIDDIRAVAPEAKIVLVDSSSDRTPELAAKKGAHVIRQLPPRGHGPAMEKLMYEASKESDALIYLDCDFTYPTGTIKQIRELLEAGADVVNTSRTQRFPKEMPIPNFIANRVFAATAQIVHGVPTTDVHSGMRGYRSSVIRAFDFDGEGDALPLDTLILPAKSHYHVAELPIPYLKRMGYSKLAKLRGTVWTFARIASAIGEGSRVRRGVRYRHVDN